MVVFAPYYPPAYLGGGPAQSLSALASRASDRFDIHVVTRGRDLGASEPLDVGVHDEWITCEGTHVCYVSTNRPRRYAAALIAARRAAPSVVYFNSFFDAAMSIGPQLLGLAGWWRGTTRVVAVRGEFGGAALGLKSAKKLAFIRAFRLLRLDRGIVWHATNEAEVQAIRRVMGPGAQVLLREEISTCQERPLPPSEDRRQLRAAFLGRVVPIKGLDTILRALVSTRARVELDVFGPEEDPAYSQLCRSLCHGLPPSVTVNWMGTVPHQSIQDVLGRYDVFLAPTHGENFGHVFAEALSAGLPVLAMDVTPWTDVLRGGGGMVISGHTDEAWARAIQQVHDWSPDERRAARERALEAFRGWHQGLPDETILDDVTASRPTGPSAADT